MDSRPKTISASDRGPLLTTIAWVFMVVMLLAIVTKIWNKWHRLRSLMLDDLLLALAAMFAVAQTIVINVEVSAGLGQNIGDLDSDQKAKIAKGDYTAQILYIIALFLTKAGTSCFIIELVPVRWVVLSMKVFMISTATWFLCAFFVLVFQCKLPHPWDFTSSTCINKGFFWGFFGAIDMLTDLWLVCLPVLILSVIQATRAKRTEIISSFVVRILTVPLIVLRLVYIVPAYRPPGIPSSIIPAAITTEVHMHMGIVFACAPFIKAVIESMQHGMIAGELTYASDNDNSKYGDSISLHNIVKSFTREHERTAPAGGPNSPHRIDRSVHPYHELGPRVAAEAASTASKPQATSTPIYERDGINVETTITTEFENAKEASESGQNVRFGVR